MGPSSNRPPSERTGPEPTPAPLRWPVLGNSDTTIYTRAVPSASPSQQAQIGPAVPMNRLDLSLNAAAGECQASTNRVGDRELLMEPCRNLNPDQTLNVAAPQLDPPPVDQSSLFPNSDRDLDDRRCGVGDPTNPVHQERIAAKTCTDAMVVEAERQKLELERPLAGTIDSLITETSLFDNPRSSNLQCDNKLFALAVHVDKATKIKIENGEFVDLSKLLPHDKVLPDDEFDKVEIVSKDGKPAFNPVVDKDTAIINSFKKWEAAFDVYAGIFVKAHPRCGPEIFEYKHTIRKALESFVWSSIYAYDKVFRTHMETNKGRTWGKKIKDAWSDHVHMHLSKATSPNTDTLSARKRKCCRYFNKNGHCTKGGQSEFDHQCSVCFMFGHGKYNCRKNAKKETAPSPGAAISSKNQDMSISSANLTA